MDVHHRRNVQKPVATRARDATADADDADARAKTMMGGPFKLPTTDANELANEAAKKWVKKGAIERVKGWVAKALPKEHLDDGACVIDVSEIQCGDPSCAPIDTVVRIIYRDGCGTTYGIPCEVEEVEEIDVDEHAPPMEIVEDWYNGTPTTWPPEPEVPDPGPVPTDELRFAIGTRVQCRIGPGEDGWAGGAVVAHWYRGSTWPTGQYAPYQIQLDRQDMGSGLIFAPQDHDNCIRLEKF